MPTPGGLYLRALGALELEESPLTRPKPLLLLAYLSLEGAKERRHLCELFYRDTSDPKASLRVALRHIREASDHALATRGTSVDAVIESDVRDLLAAAESHDDDRAIALYRGPFLHGAPLDGLPYELGEWALGTRERLAFTVRQSVLRKAEALAATGAVRAAAGWAEKALLLPHAPPLEYDQMGPIHGLLAAAGSAHASELLAEMEELGIRVDPVGARSLRPTAGAGLGAAAMGASTHPHNLTSPDTSFVGREPELEALTDVLQDPNRRLVTLLGPGGIGKTRLAIELARKQSDTGRWDGVYFVPMDDARDGQDITARLWRTLSHASGGAAEDVQELVDAVGRRSLLLILDGYEPRRAGTGVLTDLVQGCPGICLLVTSRERLRLAAESAYHLEGLPLPPPAAARASGDPEHAPPSPSVELFIDRARSADLRYRPTPEQLERVREICRLVEGSPLGIELAAAWVRALPVEDILERLTANLDALSSPDEGAPARHRTLRAAFESSWDHLDSRERTIFARLAVFRDGFRREDAAAVADASIPILAALIDKSLLRVSPFGRYGRHTLLARFAAEKLAERPQELRTYEVRHAHHFMRLAEEIEPRLRSPDQAIWLERLEGETGNFQAALAWALRAGDRVAALRLAGALGAYWYVRSAFEEGRHWLDAALAQPLDGHGRLRSKALHAAGRLARSHGDFEQAQAQLEEALDRSRQEDDRHRVVECLNELGITAAGTADYEAAIGHFQRAVELATALGDDRSLIKLFNNLGLLHAIVGRLDEAETFDLRGLDIARTHGDKRNIAHAHANLALVALHRGEYGRAQAGYDESIAIAEELRDSYLIAEAHLGKATASHLDGAHDVARTYLRTCLELFHEQHDRLGLIESLGEVAGLAVTTGHPELAARLWGALDVLRDRLAFPMQPFARRRYERDQHTVNEILSATEIATLRAEGAGWGLARAGEVAQRWLQ